MSKVYVSNYEYSDTKPGDKGYPYQKIGLGFELRAENAVAVDNREIALTGCSSLNRSGIIQNGHECTFELEKLPSGKFVIACETEVLGSRS